MFLKEDLSMLCFFFYYYCEILLQLKITGSYFNIFKNVLYSCYGKTEFSASLLQSSESHDPSEIILIWFIWNL